MKKKEVKKTPLKEEKDKKVKRIIRKPLRSKKEDNNKSASFSLAEVIIIVIVTGFIVSIASGFLIYSNYEKINAEFNKNNEEKDHLNEFVEAYQNILGSYVEKVDEEKLINAAIEGMFNFLEDTYTSYLPVDETTALTEILTGEYEGIGVEITSSSELDYVLIVNVFDNTPASKAGLQAGDEIIEINKEDMKGQTASYVSNLIKNTGKTEIEIKYKRDDKEYATTLILSHVEIPSITSKMYDSVGYIYISTFAANTAKQFKDALEDLEKQGMKSLVIDVRNNTGGYLSTAVDIAEYFLKKDDVIYKLKDRNNKITTYRAKYADTKDYKIVVATNGGSASASEILAAALKESYGATLVGIKSYGKGSIQETETLSSGAMIKYTTAYWLTPNGNEVNEIGITPDIEITESSDKEDLILNKALEVAKE